MATTSLWKVENRIDKVISYTTNAEKTENKDIYKALHRTIHQFLRDNNISANSDHWMAIRDLVNSTDEFMYIKC